MALKQFPIPYDDTKVTAGDLGLLAAFWGRPAQMPQLDAQGKPVLDAQNNVVMVANPATPLQFVQNFMGGWLADQLHQAKVGAATAAAAAGVAPTTLT